MQEGGGIGLRSTPVRAEPTSPGRRAPSRGRDVSGGSVSAPRLRFTGPVPKETKTPVLGTEYPGEKSVLNQMLARNVPKGPETSVLGTEFPEKNHGQVRYSREMCLRGRKRVC